MSRGINVTERPTSVLSPSQVAAGIPVIVGTAPVNLTKEASMPVNKPVLAYSYSEAVNAFGYSEDWANYTLCEFMDSYFRLFGLTPAIFINVIDPAVHKSSVAPQAVTALDGVAKVSVEGIILSSVTVDSYVEGTDYTIAFDSDGYLVVTRKASGSIPANTTTYNIGYDKLDPSTVDETHIIGGVDANGKATGLELINEVFPRFGLVPGLILAPGFSQDPTVAAVMEAKASNINAHFKALALTDIPADTVDKYSDAPAWKNTNNYTSSLQVAAWPMVKLGDKKYHMSTQIACLIGSTDVANDGVPVASPSNKRLKADSAILDSGAEVYLGLPEANYLNSQGIVTALNFVGGWKLWGNNTGAYPASSDVKDIFIPLRRMFIWVANTVILTYWDKIDHPATNRLIETVTDSINIWLNGLTSNGYLLGGRVEFFAQENTTADMMNGKFKFNLFITPPSPAEEFQFVIEYDPNYLQGLFG